MLKHIAYINERPVKSGAASAPDGALNGNGDLGIVLGDFDGGMRIYLSKCDIRQGIEEKNAGGARPLGYIDVAFPREAYDDYHVEQDMDAGELRCSFGGGVRVDVRVCRTENSVLLETENISAAPVLKAFEQDGSGVGGSFDENDCSVIFRSFAGGAHLFETHAYAALKNAGGGRWYIAVATGHDAADPRADVLRRAGAITTERYELLKKEHYDSWRAFWDKSSFTLSDEALENRWYASLYLLACCAGNKDFAPGLYGNFITVESPSWKSDYHLNYNYQAPFYAACSSNHVELTDCYHAPLEQFIARGRELAAGFDCRGVLMPVGIDSMGLCSEMDKSNKYWFERLFLGQKSNGVHAADIMVFRWYATRDKDYARMHALPFVREVLRFFEDYAVFENGRYSVYRDAAHEVPYYRDDFDPKKFRRYINDKNNSLTLGMLRLCLGAAIDMSEALGEDETQRRQWRDMLDKLSPFPTCIRRFRRVFRYTEKGMRWHDGNDVGQQHIYPAGCVGLGSDKRLLRIARNTFRQKEDCWTDGNAVCSYFPMAARLGVDPEKIVRKLRELASCRYAYPNMLFDFGCGCTENISLYANTLNEMALQSHEGVIRLFPVWDGSIDAVFRDLRADGAFLVSSSVKGGRVGKTEVFAEVGGELKIMLPFERCRVTRPDKTETLSGTVIVLKTRPGERILFEEA